MLGLLYNKWHTYTHIDDSCPKEGGSNEKSEMMFYLGDSFRIKKSLCLANPNVQPNFPVQIR
jgi:hypothetical protein